MEDLRYKVSIRKVYKVIFVICAIVYLFAAVGCAISSIRYCTTVRDYIVLGFICIFLLFFSLVCINQIIKSVSVYKGKIIYKALFVEKEYKPSDVYCSKTEIVETEGFSSVAEGTMPGCGTWDKVTKFYDKSGKKLFAFGLSYENVSELENNITNNRKSFNGSRNK